MKTPVILFSALCASVAACHAVTTLPVGPIGFSTDTDYDNNFKEGSTGSLRRDTDSVRVTSTSAAVGVGSAVYDTSVTPGTGGNGGTGGSDANNDLSDFMVSSLIQFQNRGVQATAGYFLRLNDSEAGGYLATVTFYNTSGTISARFDLFKNVDINLNPTTSASAGGPASAFASYSFEFATLAATNFNFSVTAVGSDFTFRLANAANTTSASHTFSDPGTSILSGQVGIFLRAQSQASTSTSRMDDFTISQIPEPGSAMLLGSTAALLLARRRRRAGA